MGNAGGSEVGRVEKGNVLRFYTKKIEGLGRGRGIGGR